MGKKYKGAVPMPQVKLKGKSKPVRMPSPVIKKMSGK